MFSPPLYIVRKIPFKEIVDADYHIQGDCERYFIKQSDSPMLRQIRKITFDDEKFNKYIIFVDCKGAKNKTAELKKIVQHGFKVNGQKFEISERSASMQRNAIMSFVDNRIIKELNKRVRMDMDIDKTVLSKLYAYMGLYLSSCHCIEDWVPKTIVVPDYYRVIPKQRIKYLYDNTTEFIDKDTGEKRIWTQKDITEKTTDSNFIGDMIALLLLRIKQNTVRSDDKNFLKMDYDWLKRELATTPLLVPFNYDNDNRANSAKDISLHMTDAANRQLSRLLRDENNQPKNPIPSYYGTKLLTGEKFGIIWNGDTVMYYGGMEKTAEAADDGKVNSDHNGPKIMRPFFADNSKTDTHMLAAFTNIRDLRNLYPDKRIAVFSFGELAALSKEGDGIVFDPGSASLSFEMDRTAIEKLI